MNGGLLAGLEEELIFSLQLGYFVLFFEDRLFQVLNDGLVAFVNFDDFNLEFIIPNPFALDFFETTFNPFPCDGVPDLQDHLKVFFEVGFVLVVLFSQVLELFLNLLVFFPFQITFLHLVDLLLVKSNLCKIMLILFPLLNDVFLVILRLFFSESVDFFQTLL